MVERSGGRAGRRAGGSHAAASRPSGAGSPISAFICASVSRPLNDGIAFGKPLTMKAPGSSIDSRMYSSAVLPFSMFAACGLQLVQVRADRAGGLAGRERVAAGAAGGGEDLLAGLGLRQAGRGQRARVLTRACRRRSRRRRPRRWRPRPSRGPQASRCAVRGCRICLCTIPSTVSRSNAVPERGRGRRRRGSGPVVPCVPARASVWQEPHFSTNCALPVSRSGVVRGRRRRAAARSRAAASAASAAVTVFRARLTGAGTLPAQPERKPSRRPCAAAITPSPRSPSE